MATILRTASLPFVSVISKLGRPITMLRAILSTPKAPPAIAADRINRCMQCPLMRRGRRKNRCSICGCDIAKLSAYEENLPEWGCKHPQRAGGHGWAG